MQNRIHEMWLKVKSAGEEALVEWGLIVVIFLVAFASFGLGRLSAVEKARPAVSVSQAPEESKPRGMAIGGLVVASRNGSVYHYPWCAGAAQIAPANQVWYASEDAAREAGYSPAKNCAGLGDE